MKNTILLFVSLLTFYCCNSGDGDIIDSKEEKIIENSDTSLRAGYRFSSYGIEYDAGVEYWVNTGNAISNIFAKASPATIWIVGVLRDPGTYLNFPAETQNPLIQYSDTDYNEEILTEFDKNGFKIWLQIEPGNAPVEELIPLVLNKYKHHSCVIGFGVDVEWYKSVDAPDGEPVSDDLAQSWLDLIHAVNPEYNLFLKHWLIEKMPPTKREGIVFIDDSQMFNSMDQMVSEFVVWGKEFSPAKVGFQFGYPADKKWWAVYDDPMRTISKEILNRIPNTQGLYWVDFTLFDVYPPSNTKDHE